MHLIHIRWNVIDKRSFFFNKLKNITIEWGFWVKLSKVEVPDLVAFLLNKTSKSDKSPKLKMSSINSKNSPKWKKTFFDPKYKASTKSWTSTKRNCWLTGVKSCVLPKRKNLKTKSISTRKITNVNSTPSKPSSKCWTKTLTKLKTSTKLPLETISFTLKPYCPFKMPEFVVFKNNSDETFKFLKTNTWPNAQKWKELITIIWRNSMIWSKLSRRKIRGGLKKIKLKNRDSENKLKIKTLKNKTILSSTSNPSKPNITLSSNKCIKNTPLILEKELKSIQKPSKTIKIWLKKLMNSSGKSAQRNPKLTSLNSRSSNTKNNVKPETMPWKSKRKTF